MTALQNCGINFRLKTPQLRNFWESPGNKSSICGKQPANGWRGACSRGKKVRREPPVKGKKTGQFTALNRGSQATDGRWTTTLNEQQVEQFRLRRMSASEKAMWER